MFIREICINNHNVVVIIEKVEYGGVISFSDENRSI